jgi:hypothetical protein
VIKDFIIWGITALPFKRNLIPRFMKGGGALRNDEGRIDHGERRSSK